MEGLAVGQFEDDHETKRELAEALFENEPMLLQALLGPDFEEQIKEGRISSMPLEEMAEIMFKSELAKMMYPKDKTVIGTFIEANRP